ncbi:MAG: BatA domain-containing protein [Dyadobacter sp.]|uniref:BatA domain-containing protein n=1 Tax=Dyadobacter sp. TaxID=1914288 RepID=UPI003264FF82
MELLQPYMLWGILAVTLPVIIHFWYQKKGKPIAWAASKWLTEKTTLQHRGVRLDEIPLLLIRCLLIILLVLILGKPVWNWLTGPSKETMVHLVQPNRSVFENFRFEIENAKKKGEKVFWIDPEKQELTDIESVPQYAGSAFFLQKTINQLAGTSTNFSLYITDDPEWAELPNIYIPGTFRLFSTTDSSRNEAYPYLEMEGGKKLFIGPGNGQLMVAEEVDISIRFAQKPVHAGKIHVLIDYKNPIERQTVQAGLLALAEVYQIPFAIDNQQINEKKYQWILTDHEIKKVVPRTLYIISGKAQKPDMPGNVIQLPDSLRLSTSGLVESGELPEWLGNALVSWFKLKQNNAPLSQKALNALFVKIKPDRLPMAEKGRQWLLVLFLLTLLTERWMALGKNVRRNYA